MNLDKIIITLVGSLLIFFIYWFFFGKKEQVVGVEDGKFQILVEGGYKPGVIKIKNNMDTELIFKRTDQNSCLEEIVIPDLKIRQFLPLNQEVSIKINAKHKGEYDIHCGMNMFHAKLIVE